MRLFSLKKVVNYSCLVVAVILVCAVGFFVWAIGDDFDEMGVSDGYCNIAVLPINGEITTREFLFDDPVSADFVSADDMVFYINQAERDPFVEGVLVQIDSLGGAPVASEIITNAIKRLSLPTASVIREYGTSGGYLIATGADTIIASPFSDVGGIGITMSYVENWRQNESDGLGYVPLSSAQFKDYLDPNKPLAKEERLLIERDLAIWHEEFVKQVSENRDIPLEEVSKLADGSSMPSKLALENGLIDTIGDSDTARGWFATQLGVSIEEVVFCE